MSEEYEADTCESPGDLYDLAKRLEDEIRELKKKEIDMDAGDLKPEDLVAKGSDLLSIGIPKTHFIHFNGDDGEPVLTIDLIERTIVAGEDVQVTHAVETILDALEPHIAAAIDRTRGQYEENGIPFRTRGDVMALKLLLTEGLSIDGAHHKQYYLRRIGELFGVDVESLIEHEPGVRP